MATKRLDLLVVDDHRLTRSIVGEILSAAGRPRLRFAEDGAQAVEMILQSPPDIAIIDVHMPFDGLSLLGFIRRGANSPDPSLPVIVMTSLAGRSQVVGYRDAGADEIIVKPFTAKAVLARVAAVIDHPRPFVRHAAYIGPDRRRGTPADYQGPRRRESDSNALMMDI